MAALRPRRAGDVRSRLFDAQSDPGNLVLRTLAASAQLAAVGADEIVAFIEDSFGAFQQRQAAPLWEWGRANLEAAVADLARHQPIEDEGAAAAASRRSGRLAGPARARGTGEAAMSNPPPPGPGHARP